MIKELNFFYIKIESNENETKEINRVEECPSSEKRNLKSKKSFLPLIEKYSV
ncbi:hypothetical protein [Chryseobacterium carnipullorum]|uniref:hypothetical protein n=1 Tax=Chryseobacterium carnipullorum TaxID=1124835 RepID=UPI0013DE1FE4|nr:hypothetical protein [Chryseobacterium carnipullorum]